MRIAEDSQDIRKKNKKKEIVLLRIGRANFRQH